MSLRLRDALMRELETLRYEPIDKRIRGVLGGDTVVDGTRLPRPVTSWSRRWLAPRRPSRAFRGFPSGGAAR